MKALQIITNFCQLILLFVMALILVGCPVEDEPVVIPIGPDIEIVSPKNYTEFNSSDTIAVIMNIKSDYSKVDLTLRLWRNIHFIISDSHYSTVTPGDSIILYFPFESWFSFDELFTLTVTATAPDNGQTNESVQVYISGTPKELHSIWLISNLTSNTTSVKTLSPALELLHEFTFQGNYAGSDVQSARKKFVIAGSNFGDLTVYDADTYAPEWNVPIISNPVQPYFTDVKFYDDLLYVSYWDGLVKGYNRDGIKSYQAEGLSNVVPQLMHLNSDKLYSPGFQRSNVSQNWWVTSNLKGGMILYSQPITFEPVGFTNLSNSEILIFANNSDGKLDTKKFHGISSPFSDPYEPFSLPDEKLNYSCFVSGSQVLLATENGIYHYKYEESIYQVSDLPNVVALGYDDLNELIWAASGNTLYTMTFSGEIVEEYAVENDILNFHLLYK